LIADADPAEHHNVAAAHATIWSELFEAVLQLNATVYSPTRRANGHDGAACDQALKNGNFWGPFLP
jgi:hypothetical protein